MSKRNEAGNQPCKTAAASVVGDADDDFVLSHSSTAQDKHIKERTSVHISFTFSKTMLQCLSKALTRPSSFLLFLQLIRTCTSAPHLVSADESHAQMLWPHTTTAVDYGPQTTASPPSSFSTLACMLLGGHL